MVVHADVVTGLLTLLARLVAVSQYKAETRAQLAVRFAPALVQQHTVDFDVVRYCQALTLVAKPELTATADMLCGLSIAFIKDVQP